MVKIFFIIIIAAKYIINSNFEESICVNARRHETENEKMNRLDKEKVQLEKNKVIFTKCKEIEDQELLFNCLNYYMSTKCFYEAFGSRGKEFGEILDPKYQLAFDSCWNEEKGIYLGNPHKLDKEEIIQNDEDLLIDYVDFY